MAAGFPFRIDLGIIIPDVKYGLLYITVGSSVLVLSPELYKGLMTCARRGKAGKQDATAHT